MARLIHLQCPSHIFALAVPYICFGRPIQLHCPSHTTALPVQRKYISSFLLTFCSHKVCLVISPLVPKQLKSRQRKKRRDEDDQKAPPINVVAREKPQKKLLCRWLKNVYFMATTTTIKSALSSELHPIQYNSWRISGKNMPKFIKWIIIKRFF